MLCFLLNKFFGIKTENNKIIQNIQNINTLIVSGFTAITAIAYFTYSSYFLLPYTLNLILYHCSVDLLLTNNFDLLIHHIITISLIKCFFYRPFPLEKVHFETLILCLTELSSIFLVGREWLDKKSFLYKLNNYAFITSFFYIRLYLLPTYLLLNEPCNNILLSFMSDLERIWYFGTLYLFMAINIYWGLVIFKSILSKVRKHFPSIFTFANNEFFLQFTYFLSPIISIYVYNPVDGFEWFDFIGQCLLAHNSCMYHYILYNAINDTPYDSDVHSIDVLSPKIRPYYIADIISIHVRAFLCIATRLTTMYPFGFAILMLFSIYDLITIYHFYDYTFEMIEEKTVCGYATTDTLADHVSRLPILISIFISISFSDSLISSHHHLLSFLLIACVLLVKPAYELNHLLLHFALLYQTYAASLCNIAY